MAAKTTYTAAYGGRVFTRTSVRSYSHASVVRWSDGTVAVNSWHTSEAAAVKGTLTAQQKQNGASVVAAVQAVRQPDLSAVQTRLGRLLRP